MFPDDMMEELSDLNNFNESASDSGRSSGSGSEVCGLPLALKELAGSQDPREQEDAAVLFASLAVNACQLRGADALSCISIPLFCLGGRFARPSLAGASGLGLLKVLLSSPHLAVSFPAAAAANGLSAGM